MKHPLCNCGGKISRICPVCLKKGGVIIDEEHFYNCPTGWLMVDNRIANIDENCPPYAVCSDNCYKIFVETQQLKKDYDNGDKNVVLERLENGRELQEKI